MVEKTINTKWCFSCKRYHRLTMFYPHHRYRDSGDKCMKKYVESAQEKRQETKQESKRLISKELFDDTTKKNYLI